jgi:glycosyltransferase involved in cell wall biosynthesis
VTTTEGPIDVVLVASSPWSAELSDDDLNLRTAHALAERLGGRYDVIVPAGVARPGRIDRDPVHVHRVEVRSRPGFLLAAQRALRELRDPWAPPRRPPVVVSSDPLAALAVESSRFRHRYPHLVHIQGEVLTPGPRYGGPVKRWTLSAASRFVVRRASAVRVASRSLENAVARITHRPVTFIGNRVDTRVFRPADGPVTGPDRSDAIMIGGLHPAKNHRTVVHAWARVVRSRPDAVLTIIGDGPRRSALEALINCLGLTANVRLLGRMSQAGLLPLLRGARCLVHAALTDGQPRAVLEGMACGLPVVCSDLPGHREIVPPGAGLLVPAEDIAAWTGALTTVLGDPERAAAMGRAGRAYVVEHHDFEANADRMAELIRRVAAAVPQPVS